MSERLTTERIAELRRLTVPTRCPIDPDVDPVYAENIRRKNRYGDDMDDVFDMALRTSSAESDLAALRARVLEPADAERIRAALDAGRTLALLHDDDATVEFIDACLALPALQATPAAGTGPQQEQRTGGPPMTTAINEAIQLAYDAMSDAFTDIGQWCQLAESQRELSPRPDYEPRCPSKSGIEVSRTLQRRLGNVMAEIRKHLSPHMGREDDATAIDADWLTSVLRQNPNTLNWLLRRSTPLTIEIEESGGGFWMWFCHDRETPVPIRQLKTRADVRDACRGLGVITLSETEKGAHRE